MSGSQKPLELILARNLLTSVTTPAFLVARDGTLLFYNEGAGALIGRPFEDTGQLDLDEWTASLRARSTTTTSRCRSTICR